MNNIKLFRTTQFALTAFLELKGLKYIKAELEQGRNGKFVVAFYFLDNDDKGKDLELEFRHSDFAKYRNFLFFYKKIISDKMGN